MSPENPYQKLPASAFWRSAVAEVPPTALHDLYEKKWSIAPTARIATAGSCFAQHISRHLRRNGFEVLDLEPPPPGLPPQCHTRFGYSMYSARYGNIYTTQQLLQLAREVEGALEPKDAIWERDGAFFDAFRPGVEPLGLDSPAEVERHRQHHLSMVREMFQSMDLFVFTLGLTETWLDRKNGTYFPIAPGVVAGEFDPSRHQFKNCGFEEVRGAFLEFQDVLRRLRKDHTLPRMLLTVSPVPLTATAAGRHVLQATTYSKAVLRAVAGELAESHEHIDYFPSYEIITNQAARGAFYEDNLRSVQSEGVETVMAVFFSQHAPCHDAAGERAAASQRAYLRQEQEEELQCEEALLEGLGE